MLSGLEGLAVTLHGEYASTRLEALRSINAGLRSAAGSPEGAFDLDRRWHRTLAEGCGNPGLLEHWDLSLSVFRSWWSGFPEDDS